MDELKKAQLKNEIFDLINLIFKLDDEPIMNFCLFTALKAKEIQLEVLKNEKSRE